MVDKIWVPAFVTKVTEEEREVEVVTLTPVSTQKRRMYEWPEFGVPTQFPFALILGEIEVEVKSTSITVKEVREIGKKLTQFKHKMASKSLVN